MNEKEKAVYEAKATKDKERYEAEKRAYNVLHPLFLKACLSALTGLNVLSPPSGYLSLPRRSTLLLAVR